MERKILNELVEWKKSRDRIPLLIVGARQVGKTYIITEFAKKYYSNFVYCNFEKQSDICKIFDYDLQPKRIVSELEIQLKTKIEPEKTLIIFDEIQACPKALTSLKYFKEEKNEYHVIASGSLLGVAINRGGFSFPVGCVTQKRLYPMDFEEFLMALDQKSLIKLIKDSYKTHSPFSEPIHKIALDYYKKYLFVGGMPDSVQKYLNTNNFILVRERQMQIIGTYLNDLSKYNSPINANKVKLIFNNISIQLAKENRKFKYSLLKTGARASEYEIALNWICSSGLTNQLFKLEEIKKPINAYYSLSDFKLYLNDVGLLCAMQNIQFSDIQNNNLKEFLGGLTENYVYNQLKTNGFEPFYWTSKYDAEIDFIIQIQSDIIPIEVKSNTNNHSPSLNVYTKKFKPPYSIKISAKNFGFENNIKSIPLYAVFNITKQ